MTSARRVAWNTIVQSTARVGTLTLSVVTTVLLTRYLGVSGYGAYVTVTAYVLFWAVFFDFGITTLLTRELSVDVDEVLFRQALAARALIACIVALAAAGVALAIYSGPGDKPIRDGILIASPIIFLNGVVSVPISLFQARLRMDRVALAEITAQILAAAGIVAAVLLGGGLNWVLIATVGGVAVNAALLVVLVRRFATVRPLFSAAASLEIIRRALPIGLGTMIATVYFRADAILLSVISGPRAVGIYGVAYRLLEAAIVFPGFFILSVFPLLSAAAKARDFDAVRTGAQRAFDVLALAAIPFVATTLVLAPEITDLLAGRRFAASATPLRIIVVGAGLMFVNVLYSYLLIAIEEQRTVLWISGANLVFNVALNIALIPSFSYKAAASVATASEVMSFIAFAIVTARKANFVPSLSVVRRGLVAGGAMTVALLLAPTFALAVVLGVLAYVLVLLLLRTHEALELRELLQGRE